MEFVNMMTIAADGLNLYSLYAKSRYSVEVLVEYVHLYQQDETKEVRKELLRGEYRRLEERIADLQAVKERLACKIDNYDDLEISHKIKRFVRWRNSYEGMRKMNMFPFCENVVQIYNINMV